METLLKNTTPFKLHLRWSDLDPNFHLRHSCYYDLASQARIEILDHHGLTLELMEKEHVAPILLHEECTFSREIKAKDSVYIHIKIREVSADGMKWKIEHEFIDDRKKRKGLLITDISWLNTQTRRIAKPLPESIVNACTSIMKSKAIL